MNIPPDNQINDLNRGPPPPPPHPILGPLQSFFTQVIDANKEWTDAKDFAFRLTIPLFSMAAVAMFNRFLEKRERLICEGEDNLKLARGKLAAERLALAAEKGAGLERPLATVVDDLMAQGNRQSYKALQEIDSLQPLIKDVLRIKCSPTTSREGRYPIEREIRARILKQPSLLDGVGNLKAQMLEDTLEIFNKDIAHCDLVWPFGHGNNGELYKVYKENWRLRVDLEKHKRVVEQLKHLSRHS